MSSKGPASGTRQLTDAASEIAHGFWMRATGAGRAHLTPVPLPPAPLCAVVQTLPCCRISRVPDPHQFQLAKFVA